MWCLQIFLLIVACCRSHIANPHQLWMCRLYRWLLAWISYRSAGFFWYVLLCAYVIFLVWLSFWILYVLTMQIWIEIALMNSSSMSLLDEWAIYLCCIICSDMCKHNFFICTHKRYLQWFYAPPARVSMSKWSDSPYMTLKWDWMTGEVIGWFHHLSVVLYFIFISQDVHCKYIITSL
jgi:hypothetical protein